MVNDWLFCAIHLKYYSSKENDCPICKQQKAFTKQKEEWLAKGLCSFCGGNMTEQELVKVCDKCKHWKNKY